MESPLWCFCPRSKSWNLVTVLFRVVSFCRHSYLFKAWLPLTQYKGGKLQHPFKVLLPSSLAATDFWELAMYSPVFQTHPVWKGSGVKFFWLFDVNSSTRSLNCASTEFAIKKMAILPLVLNVGQTGEGEGKAVLLVIHWSTMKLWDQFVNIYIKQNFLFFLPLRSKTRAGDVEKPLWGEFLPVAPPSPHPLHPLSLSFHSHIVSLNESRPSSNYYEIKAIFHGRCLPR